MSLRYDCLDCNYKMNCFKGLDSDELNLMCGKKTELKYKKGEIVCKQGAFASDVMFIKNGYIKLNSENKNKIHTLRIIPAGEYLGLSSLFKDNYYHYSVITVTDSVICHFDRNILCELISQNGRFGSEIIKKINTNKIQIIARYTSLIHKQAHGRIADLLIYLAKDVYKSESFHFNLSRQELAELTGLAKETIVRVLKEFDHDKIITLFNKTVSINKMNLLLKLSEVG